MGPFKVGIDGVLKVLHKRVAPHLLRLEKENLEGSSLLRIWRAWPVAVIGPGAAASFLPRQLSAAAVQ